MPSPPAETFVFILPSIHHVLRGEKLLKKAGLDFDLIPVPKEVNPDCGMAIETGPDDLERVRAALNGAGLSIEAFYRRRGKVFDLLD
ncbi:MAG: DUF3343 domain-containing protein [Proteobacteria bacterium]|nr:DUF3343 domain-containing protein [Pseudomonadota bacterium]